MLKLLGIQLLLFLQFVHSLYNATPSNLSYCQSPERQTCTFYNNCLEMAHPCGANGYAMNFGSYYCKRFAAFANSFSPNGEEWMYNTMQCLQLQLVPVLNNATISCSQIKEYAFASHSKCYVHSGGPSICTLSPFTDWLTVLRVIGVTQLFKPQIIHNGFSILGECLPLWLQRLQELFFSH
ncbi:hypothetical protein THRCLA_21850 [Thraustotheca clavata]|uniref:Secreted protein n=1 Tax=Thraustotheca clavata TaxID=74557 RepID=A0A1V9ZMW2_9STRA|nr:hypothetical protein THRCLA_21850 [Thraustotheca clavata]